VCDDDARHRESLLRVDDELVDLLGHQGVEARARLIVADDGRLDGDGPREAHALLHAARELVRHHVLDAVEPDEVQLLADDLLDVRIAELRVLAQAEGDVLADGHRVKKRRVLEDHAHLEADLVELRLTHRHDVLPVDEDLAARRLDEADEQAQERALARARAADDGERLPVVDRQADVLERILVVKAHADVLEFNHSPSPSSVQQERQHGVQQEDDDDRGDDRLRRRPADALRPIRAVQAVVAAEHRDDIAEEDGLDDAARHVEQIRKDVDGVHVAVRRQSLVEDGDEPAAEDADDIAEDREDRHDDHAGEHARHEQVVDGAHGHDAQRVDLFCDLHRRDLRRDGRTDAAGADDGDEHWAELAADRDRDNAAERALCAEADEDIGCLQRDDDTREQQRQADDHQGIDAEMRHLREDMAQARLVA
jgi:hypothetical protein